MGALAGKVGVVTGAGRGIGAAIAKLCAAEGAAVVVNDVGAALNGAAESGRPAEEIASEINSSGGKAIANFDSVSSWEGARNMVASAVSTFGRIDFVVNNAGVLRDVMFHKMREEDWDAVIDVHLKGNFCVCRAAAEHFRAQGSGAIVNMTSTSGLIGSMGQVNYAAAKLGIVALTRGIALDMQRFGVRANCVAPFAWTRMTQSIPTDSSPESVEMREQMKQLTPEQIAPLVAFLVSDGAKAVNGQIFAVRGTEIALFSVPKPTRSLHHAGEWTVQQLADVLPDALARNFEPLAVTNDFFGHPPLL